MALPMTLDQRERLTLDDLAAEIRVRRPVVAFTGAGISTESGIPDFRGPSGLWKRSKPTKYRDFLARPDVRLSYWERRRTRYPVLAGAEPNPGHRALSRLQQAGYLCDIITQNIDGLHQKAGSPAGTVIELHGSAHHIRCVACRTIFVADEFPLPEAVMEPTCPICGGIVKEATISFGESLEVEDLRRALEIARGADLVLVVGSSLQVNPAARIPQVAQQAGAGLAIINNEPTPLDDRADYVIRSSAGAALSYLTDLLVG
ncbi:MAG TPA: Sir2 family NAD-dependent protein deacetylase [Thermomicrobiaceae bacterium]|nr:Sir2 family NAD-dependent protein deacetylase [Thermomicrobiaceae bacterium]